MSTTISSFSYIFQSYSKEYPATLKLNKLKASTVGIFIYLQPVIAGLFAISMGADFIDSMKIGAMFIIFLGVYLVTKKPKKAN